MWAHTAPPASTPSPVDQSHASSYDQSGFNECRGLGTASQEIQCIEITPPGFMVSVLPAVSAEILYKTETALREKGLLLGSYLGWTAFQKPPEAREETESAVFDSAMEAIVTTILGAAGAKPGLAIFSNRDCARDSESSVQSRTGDVVLCIRFKKEDTPVE
jgi:hypothetical protein